MNKDTNAASYCTLVFVPSGAKQNLENFPDTPPKTKYNNCTVIFDDETVRSVIGGEYGRNYTNQDK